MKGATHAAILCGGGGERLRPSRDRFKRLMTPIGPKRLPVLAYIVKLMTYYGITDVALLTGYRSEDIKSFFGDGERFGAALAYSEGPEDLGSLNAVANGLRNGAIGDCDELLVYQGDAVADLDIAALLGAHRRTGADATLVLSRGYALPVGTAEVEGWKVKSFKEKPLLDMSVATGCMVVGPAGMAMVSRLAGHKRTDLMTDFVPELLRTGGNVSAYQTKREWHDIGTLNGLERLDKELSARPPSFMTNNGPHAQTD